MAARTSAKYAVVDAFTDEPFKGNPAAVCFLEEEDEGRIDDDDEWMQSVAKEFHVPVTAFLTRAPPPPHAGPTPSNCRFNLRWFMHLREVNLCGHATIAAAHFLITSGMAKSDVIEFVTKSGVFTARKVRGLNKSDTSNSCNGEGHEGFSIELDFPMDSVVECDPTEIPSIPKTLNGLSMVRVQKSNTLGDLIIELASGEDVAKLQPDFGELKKCPVPQRGIIITGPAPDGSDFDFISRFFGPKYGVNEDPVCGSAHCALAPYWSKKLGKQSLLAYMASQRGGILDLQLEEETRRVRIRGQAVTVMIGSLLV